MVIIQNFLNSMEVILTVEYIITPLIIGGVFHWIFTFLRVIYVHYCIGDPLLNLYPTITLWCVSYALISPFSLAS